MAEKIKYLVDDNGQKTSVLVPLKVWEDLNGNFKKLQQKLDVFTSIKEGLAEIEVTKKTGRKLSTLKEFLK